MENTVPSLPVFKVPEQLNITVQSQTPPSAPVSMGVLLATTMILVISNLLIMVFVIKLARGQLAHRPLKYFGWMPLIVLLGLFQFFINQPRIRPNTLTFYNIPIHTTVIALSIYILLFVLAHYRLIKTYLFMQKAVVIPEFKLKNLKHYEIGPIYSGRLRTIDLMATLAYCRLNSGKEKFDIVEQQIVSHYKVGDFLNLRGIVTSPKGHTYVQILKKIVQPIYRKLKQDKLFAYNPRLVALAGSIIALLLVGIAPAIWISLGRSPIIYFICFIVMLVGLLAYIAVVFSEDFCENLKNILPMRRDLLGYKMFLTTTEYYRIEQDKELFAKLIPFFISLGARKDKLKEMIKRVKSLDSRY